jgi:hypothetical protein
MYCDRCGTRIQDSAAYCPSCGKALQVVPMMPVGSRLSGHLRLLGILWLAISVYRLLPGVFLFAIFRPMIMPFAHSMPFFIPGLMRGIGALMLAGAVLGILTGWGLLERQPWARTLAIVLGFISLLEMPFGTALGIYTLWVLLPAKSEEEYRRMSEAA